MQDQASLLKDARSDLNNSLLAVERALQSGQDPPEEDVEQVLGNIGVVIEMLKD